jgi:hypothetical protein
MIELIVYGSVPQSRQSGQWLSGIETKLLGGLWLLATKMFKMDSCLRGRTQFMMPMEKSVTFTGACANEIIPSINRSFVYKAKE